MKQTAAGWLIQNIVEDQTIKAKSMSEWIKIFEQAKAMEKEQIVDAFDSGQMEEAKQEFWTKGYKYYNETYGTSEKA